MVIVCLVWLMCLDISFLHFTFHGKYCSLLFFEFELNLNYSKWLCQWCISLNIFAEDICPDCLIYASSLYYDAVNELHASTMLCTQVSFACFTYCDQRYLCLFIRVLSWENTTNQVVPKENLGRFYWCISDNYHLCFSGETLLNSRFPIKIIFIATFDFFWNDEIF